MRAGNHLGAVLGVALAVEGALGAGQALVDDLGVLVYEDRHYWPPLSWARATTASAASTMVGLLISFSDSCSARIARPSAALVPSMRMTMGASIWTRPRAVTMPLATSSPLVMPPKMLMKMALTFGSLLMTSDRKSVE